MKVAVVTGANKGIGLAIVKALCQKFEGTVYLTSRDVDRGTKAVAQLQSQGWAPSYHQLDVSDEASIIKFRDYLKEKHGGIDILINNAAVSGDGFKTTYEDSKQVIDIDYRSLLTIQEHLFPLVREHGRILNISSDCGHLSNIRNKYWIDKLSSKDLTVSDINEFVNWFLNGVKTGTFDKNDLADGGSAAAYRIAKVAVCALTRLQQKELESRQIIINSMHPGLVQTDMTRGKGFFSPDEAAETPVYLVLDAPESIKGAYVWFDRKVLDWYDYKSDCYFKMESVFKHYGAVGPVLYFLARHEWSRHIIVFVFSVLFVSVLTRILS
ncbi:carbonyl reductase [NADPH] 1-like [Leguminivora glycinivorella]|uniref:carbonyl reductase [NADPH] 1-like n=1 Tax=Leguminivora glycinivorella TaxID=1035111 RepID=UPI00200C697A|nr:carbonyl reductase [NADPH] 1-like [Leguminivora glycinivorella]